MSGLSRATTPPSVDRIVIVGASLAGLRAAEALRSAGFDGHLTLIGDEPYRPYDRPPLSKAVLLGRVPADRTASRRSGTSPPTGCSGCRPPAWTRNVTRWPWPTDGVSPSIGS